MILLLNQIFCGLNGSCGCFRSGVYMRFGVDAGRYSLSGDKAADHRLQVNAKTVEQSCGSLGSGFGDVFDQLCGVAIAVHCDLVDVLKRLCDSLSDLRHLLEVHLEHCGFFHLAHCFRLLVETFSLGDSLRADCLRLCDTSCADTFRFLLCRVSCGFCARLRCGCFVLRRYKDRCGFVLLDLQLCFCVLNIFVLLSFRVALNGVQLRVCVLLGCVFLSLGGFLYLGFEGAFLDLGFLRLYLDFLRLLCQVCVCGGYLDGLALLFLLNGVGCVGFRTLDVSGALELSLLYRKLVLALCDSGLGIYAGVVRLAVCLRLSDFYVALSLGLGNSRLLF